MRQSLVNSYQSGAASLFAAMARETPPPTPTLSVTCPQSESAIGEGRVVIPCPWCLSDDTEMADHDMQIYTCRQCGDRFERPPG